MYLVLAPLGPHRFRLRPIPRKGKCRQAGLGSDPACSHVHTLATQDKAAGSESLALTTYGGIIAIQYVASRPTVDPVVQWTGSNLTELQAFCFGYVVLTDNLDGTLSIYGNPPVPTGTWIYRAGGNIPDSVYQDYLQNVGFSTAFYVFQDGPGSYTIPERRAVSAPVPAISLLGSTTVTVTWPTPMPSSSYDVSIVPQSAATLVGSLGWSLVSQSATGCVIAVKALLGITLGTILLRVACTEH